jgi:hypothetical protein
MSTILDALKKSERERTLVRGVGFGDAGRRLVPAPDRLRWIAIGAGVLSIVVMTVSYLRARSVPLDTVAATLPATTDAEDRASSPTLTAGAVATTTLALPVVGEIKMFSALPPAVQQAMPAMTVNIHVYATEESQRILYINNRQYHRGDEIPGGVRVEEIVPDGVVLQFQGHRFQLPRPS